MGWTKGKARARAGLRHGLVYPGPALAHAFYAAHSSVRFQNPESRIQNDDSSKIIVLLCMQLSSSMVSFPVGTSFPGFCSERRYGNETTAQDGPVISGARASPL